MEPWERDWGPRHGTAAPASTAGKPWERDWGPPAANSSPFAQMITGQQAPEVSPDMAESLPIIYGPAGFSSEFRDATGQGMWEGFKNSARPALADTFGNYEDVVRGLQQVAPGAKLMLDKDGIEVVQLPNGSRFALNKPGLEGREVAAGIAKTASFLPAGRIAGAGKNLLMKMLYGGAAGAATDVAMQGVAGKQELDVPQAAITAAGGAAGELLAPIVGAATRGVKSLFANDRAAVRSGKQLAAQLGITDASDDLARQIASRWDEIKAGADPAAIVAEAEMGLNLSRGQKTGDYGQLRREEMLRALDSSAGQAMRGVDDHNRSAIDSFLARLRNGMAGGEAGATVGDSFDRITKGVQAEREAAHGVVGALYDKAGETGAVAARGAINDLPGMLKKAVADFDIDKELTPAAARILGLMKEKIAAIPEAVTGISLKTIETERKRINAAIGAAANPTDRSALVAIKRTFDDWYSGLADDAIIKGDSGAIAAMKSARDARATLAQRFEVRGPSDAGGKLISRMVEGNASPEELAQAALGASQVSKVSGAQFIKRLKGALQPANGPINPAWGETKAAVLQKLTTGKGGETLGPQAIVGNLKEALRNRGTMMSALYSPAELSALQRITHTLDQIVPKGMLAKSSGTSERAFAMVEQLLKGVPGGGMLLSALKAPGQAATARNAYQPLRPRTALQSSVTAGSISLANDRSGE